MGPLQGLYEKMPRGNRGVAIAVAAAESGAWKGLLAWEATSTGVHCARSKTRLPTPRAQPLPGSPPDPEWQLLEPVSRRGSRVDEFSFGRWLPSRSCYDSTASLIRRLSTSKFPLMDKGPSISTHRKPHTAKAKKADDKLGRNTNQSIQHWGRNNSRAVTVQKRLLRCLTFSEAVAIIHLHLHDFDHVNVATTLSLLSKFQACSTAQGLDDMLRDAVENIEQHLSSTIGFAMEPRTASNTAHSLARLGFAKDSTFADLAEDIIPSLHRWGPRDLSNLVWAYATSGASSAQRVLTSAADAVVNTRDRDGLFQFNTQDISNMTWAFAAAHHSAPHLFDALAARTRELLPRFKPQELSNVLWAHAVLYHSSPELFQEAGSAVSGRWFNLQELGNTAWAYAVFDLLHRHTLRQWVSSVDFKQAAVDDRTNRSLFLAAMAAQHSGNSKMLPLPRSALRSARRCWLGNVEDVKRESQLQRDVMRALQDLGLSCASEVRTPDGAFSVDIMARIVTDGQSRNVAVEVDGPSHFASNVKSKPLGATVLRHRLLRRTVDRLVSVPYFEWSELMGDSALQLAYLKSKLKES